MNPKVSIILPTYNRAEFISHAVQSILDQTYSNWELVIWVDGSTDNTSEVIGKFVDDRILIYYSENNGKSASLNLAFELLTGEYYAFLDDDDLWEREKLERQVNLLIQFPHIDCIFTNYLNINLTTKDQGVGFSQNHVAFNSLEVENPFERFFIIKSNLPASLVHGNFIAFDTVIMRKNVFVGNRLREDLRNGEDLELWIRLYYQGKIFAYWDEVLLKRVKPPGSLSSLSIDAIKSHLRALDYICPYRAQDRKLDVELSVSYQKAYLTLALEYLKGGETTLGFENFRNSMRYKVNLITIKTLIKMLIQISQVNK